MPGSELMDVSKEPGVHDLPLAVRRWFAKALLAERQGLHDDAKVFMQNALNAEATGKSVA